LAPPFLHVVVDALTWMIKGAGLHFPLLWRFSLLWWQVHVIPVPWTTWHHHGINVMSGLSVKCTVVICYIRKYSKVVQISGMKKDLFGPPIIKKGRASTLTMKMYHHE
jgi:hypothetical protein